MKKIILIIVGILPVVIGYSQSNTTNSAAKKMTVEESNRLNGMAQPTINGIPYSQYKAQQDALKQKTTNTNNQVATTSVVSTNNQKAGGTVTDKVANPTKPAANVSSTPILPVVDNKTSGNGTITNKTTDKPAPVQLPATQTIQPGTLKTSDVSQPVVTPATTSLKTVDGNNGTASAALIAPPTIKVAVDNNALQSTTAAAINNTQQVITQARPAQTPAEIPASVANPASKIPVVPMQTTEKTKDKN